ncbi:LytR/AlgR family response regulator transcription factor [Marinigracilibium pacificum]|uniref:Response regulator transcription factor n=1 Tax=Marinigracilibium pacificum TaxID=2729599 RepID=A0A848IW96_9BACT|nr:LytTR family DNA-binding domain-containing protein [Marinigracilibium pacificum]NMM47521.1 response regulator transcription factor [Marinigracilibium pacificum]
MSVNTIIIDDEQHARKLLEDYVSKVPGLNSLGSFKNPLDALDFIKENKVDIILLDIQMPQLSGLDLVKVIKSINCKIIFTTAYSEYALEGYNLDVTDYLLKPIRFERFLQAINKAVDQIKPAKVANTLAEVYLNIKADHKMYRIKAEEIIYIEGMKEYVRYHFSDKKLMALESLKNIESILPQNKFIRVHKSFIVNSDRVTTLDGNRLVVEGEYIPIGKSYKEIVVSKLFK